VSLACCIIQKWIPRSFVGRRNQRLEGLAPNEFDCAVLVAFHLEQKRVKKNDIPSRQRELTDGSGL